MANIRDEILVEDMEVLTNEMLENILDLEDREMLDEQQTDECIYYLNKLAALLGLNVELDTFNDEYLNERNGE